MNVLRNISLKAETYEDIQNLRAWLNGKPLMTVRLTSRATRFFVRVKHGTDTRRIKARARTDQLAVCLVFTPFLSKLLLSSERQQECWCDGYECSQHGCGWEFWNCTWGWSLIFENSCKCREHRHAHLPFFSAYTVEIVTTVSSEVWAYPCVSECVITTVLFESLIYPVNKFSCQY